MIHAVGTRIAAAFCSAAALCLAPVAGAADGEVRLTLADRGALVELGEDDVLALELPANFSTGYGWHVVEGDRRVVMLLPHTSFRPDSRRTGAPGLQTLRFGAVGAGETQLILGYRPAWAADAPPAETMTVHVRTRGPFTGRHDAAVYSADARLPGWNPIAEFVEWVNGPIDDVADAYRDLLDPNTSRLVGLVDQVEVISKFPPVPLPSRFNWCEQGKCPPIKYQGNCGSCYAFATVGVLESQILIRDGFPRSLSEQYLLSCNEEGWSCAGGWELHAYHAWKFPAGEPGPGAVYLADTGYPDLLRDENGGRSACTPPHAHHERIADFGVAIGLPADLIKRIIVSAGPVTATVCTGPAFQNYGETSGVFRTNESCGSDRTNHMVILVGWDDAQGVWYLRNSWSAGWGESAVPGGERGYMRIAYGTSRVGDRISFIKYEGAPAKLWNVLPVIQTLLE